jgi:pyruvate formate lyase activating enzyme
MSKGIVFDIKRYAVHDGPGIRTTVFLKGCPAQCWWCHNPESQKPEPESFTKINVINGRELHEEQQIGKIMTVSEVISEIRKDIIYAEESGGGVTVSGGEPLMQFDFLVDLLKECKNLELHTTLDTTGYTEDEVLDAIIPLVDLFLFDLKIIDDGFHQMYTGVSNKYILRNLQTLLQSEANLIIRFPIIPGYTDTQDNLDHMVAFIKHNKINNYQIDLLPFHKLAGAKYRRFCKPDKFSGMNEPDKKTVEKIRQRFASIGMKVRIGG